MTRIFNGIQWKIQTMESLLADYGDPMDQAYIKQFFSLGYGIFSPLSVLCVDNVDLQASGFQNSETFVDSNMIASFFLAMGQRCINKTWEDYADDPTLRPWYEYIPQKYRVERGQEVGQAKILYSYLRPFVGLTKEKKLSILIVGSASNAIGGMSAIQMVMALSCCGYSGSVDLYDIHEIPRITTIRSFVMRYVRGYYDRGVVGKFDVILDDSLTLGGSAIDDPWVDVRVPFMAKYISPMKGIVEDQPYYHGDEKRAYRNVGKICGICRPSGTDNCTNCSMVCGLIASLGGPNVAESLYACFVRCGVSPCRPYLGREALHQQMLLINEINSTGRTDLSENRDDNFKVRYQAAGILHQAGLAAVSFPYVLKATEEPTKVIVKRHKVGKVNKNAGFRIGESIFGTKRVYAASHAHDLPGVCLCTLAEAEIAVIDRYEQLVDSSPLTVLSKELIPPVMGYVLTKGVKEYATFDGDPALWKRRSGDTVTLSGEIYFQYKKIGPVKARSKSLTLKKADPEYVPIFTGKSMKEIYAILNYDCENRGLPCVYGPYRPVWGSDCITYSNDLCKDTRLLYIEMMRSASGQYS